VGKPAWGGYTGFPIIPGVACRNLVPLGTWLGSPLCSQSSSPMLGTSRASCQESPRKQGLVQPAKLSMFKGRKLLVKIAIISPSPVPFLGT